MRPAADQRGLSESVQWALVTPLLLGLLLGGLHLGMHHHGTTVARDAASIGVDVVASGRPAPEATAAAERFAIEGGLRAVQVQIQPRGRLVAVVVSGDVPGPMGGQRVTAESLAPGNRP
ncbi:TadE/TadG family type IV pilus assembly protein [Parenemella sanctibonifatiensis]|uniref:TadE-like domain-containing protein n=1 Tax=Parenemella sanctibonifatiensis TaxID=2016505 RepID=A0A255EI61_9ACTN|nr:TadE/TadG family type IV pilus assembly protein [Parenemella sanctibonifatiensis]OYN90661.1 hypothetical protein CGZ92_00490 [Parenemella sanctibonifatiensis]